MPDDAPRRSRSGPNIPEEQRGTIRVRLPRDVYAHAHALARSAHISVAELLRIAVEQMTLPR